MNGEMYGCCLGIRGLFTPAQWIELEHQAMIYKYLTSNLPVPSNLLIPIRKAIQSSVFPAFSIGSSPSHSYGWGSFHQGFSGNTDPELGRCRRTDGKKWRCSREAVPDQKYCERHINRGRHRSRKPVEGHTGQATSGVATTTMVEPAMSVSVSSLVTSACGVANTFTNPIAERITDQRGRSVMHPTINLESADSQCSIGKQQYISFEESSVSDFGIVSDDSLLNPSQKISYLDGKSYDCLYDYDPSQQNQDHCPLHHLMDNWPKDPKSDWTRGFDPYQTGGGPLGEVLLNNVGFK
ncbi:hypothetical protein RND81_11G212200 [Saponaria officinalis]